MWHWLDHDWTWELRIHPSAMAAAPAVVATVQDRGEPTIVWYDVTDCDTDIQCIDA